MLSFNFRKSEAELFDEPITLEARNKILSNCHYL